MSEKTPEGATMSDQENVLERDIAHFRKGAKKYRDEHGSVEALVGLNSPFAQHGITSIDRVPIAVEEGVKLVDIGGAFDNDIEVDGSLIYFHKDDHPVFGSKAVIDDDDDDWWAVNE